MSFYYFKYGISIITSKILSNENIKIGVSRKIVYLGILIHGVYWRQPVFMFSILTEISWLTFDVIIDNPYLT